MSKLKLFSSVADQDELVHALEHTRRTSETVKVSRQALDRIMQDHGRMIAALGENVEYV